MNTIRIADFAPNPGARYRTDGPKSGEEFREDVLYPAFSQAREAGGTLLIDFDEVDGYSTGFLEEAFGGLARQVPGDIVLKTLRFKSEDDPEMVTEVEEYILEACG